MITRPRFLGNLWKSLEKTVAAVILSFTKLCLTLGNTIDCNMPISFSATIWVHSNSCPLSRQCHPTISISVAHFSSCPPSFSVLGSFPMSWPFTSGSWSVGASVSVLPMNIQGWFPLGLTGLISLQSNSKTLKSLLQHYNLKASVL